MLKNKYIFIFITAALLFSLLTNPAAAQDDSLNIAIPGRAQTLDPAYLQRVLSDWPVMNSVFNGLVKYEPGTFEVVPDLAEEWEVSEDDTEITFQLKEGIEFHKDYGEFTAEDVKFSFERIIAEDANSPEAQSFSNLERVEIVDQYTVKLILSEPMGRLFTSTLPFNAGLIVSKEAVEEMGREEFASNPIGTGPYVFEEWDVNNNITLQKNENYFEREADYGEIVFMPMSDPTSQELALQSGEIDIGQLTLDNFDQISQMEEFEAEIYPDLAIQYVAFNTSKEPLNNEKLREALRYIINPEEILVGAFAGKAERAYSILLEDMTGYWKAPSFDLDEAGEERVWELLAEAGYPEGEGLELEYVTDATEERRLIGALIQDQLSRFNIELNVEALEVGPKIDRWQEGSYDITYARFTNTVDPGYNFQWNLTDQIGKWNLFHWSNEEYDRLWQEAETTLDTDLRAENYEEMQKLMHNDSIGIWVTHGVKTPAWTTEVDPVFSPDGVVLPWLITSSEE
ncbi:peptide/nickel transport system substrate-binding protein [Halanaerobium saccharolyticum]|uniref:Peptide/nickel transport system substrate-binding protein n=1 Tax=Halanaerobium saccharolyticum TaxID=43595 RepID=A0A4R7YY12_9FIRM|nr:ABC transporter substrate-binding protein [Halanaerobium saccharolyticum]RAK06494.1 peptide/nickel transport system substrate-binding protein [Halanaerobium saccharolyticum]TDW01038.1 peptide/nickel transport system substrate-binding protein [Halanaerobium saccharolyticum]TDX52619.1 peptide/nickel transport system substrate-binding protein [Halanaerobium saccharolyticum]